MNPPAPVLDDLRRLHLGVDEAVAPLLRRHARRLRCAIGCHECCLDGLTVFEVEAGLIRRHHGELLDTGIPAPEGGCAFLDADGACRIYEHRPYVCRTQGLPLRWIGETEDGHLVEWRDICLLNENEAEPLESLDETECWLLGPVEEKLLGLQDRLDGGEMRRVGLRELFRESVVSSPAG